MPGCASRSAASTWFLNLATACAVTRGSMPSLRMIFSAIVRSGSGSAALYTVASGLAPITSAILYLPSWRRLFKDSPSLSEHLHRLHEARAHALERTSERRDLVLALDREPRGVELPQAHLVGDVGQLPHRVDHDVVEHQVERDENERKHRRERDQKDLEGILRALDRKRHRHRDDLSAHDLVQFPPEPVGRPVQVDHRLGRGLDGAVACEAGLALDLDGPREVEGAAGERLALADDLLALGVLAELGYDVALPVGDAVAGVGRVERRLLVAVVDEFLAQVVELLGRGVRGNRLRPELVLHLRLEERAHLVAGIGARGERRLHHDARVLQDLVAGVALEQVARDVRRNGEAHRENQEKYQVELDDQLHEIPSAFGLLGFRLLLLLVLPVLLREENRVPLRMRREVLDQLCAERCVFRAALEALHQATPDRLAGLEPSLDLVVARLVLALGLGVAAAHAREERGEIVPEIRRHGLHEIRRGPRRDGGRLSVAAHDELSALEVAPRAG